MALFTDIATIYNHYVENGEDKWQRTVLKGLMWSHNRVETSITGGIQTEARVESVTIDFEGQYGNAEYIEPIAFKKLTDKSHHWTLNDKDGQDIFVLGLGEEITPSYTLKKLRADHQYIGTVTSVSDNRNRMLLRTIKVVVK